MKKQILFILFLAVTYTVQAADINVRINPADRQQTIEGWGVSLCWWAHMCGKWSEEKVNYLVDLMTSPDKLNWNLFRYNIGGGDDPSHIGGHMTTGKGKRAEMEGFKASKEADYDWSADSAQRRIMLKIKAKRSDAQFEAFSNSPPYWMTYSGCSGGNYNGNDDNLKPEYYNLFCDYLLDVCKHYKDVYGLEFKTLSPFNEPVTNYWYYQGSQEGCHFSASSQIKLIRALHPKLEASGLNTIISASEETNVGTSHSVLSEYIKAGDMLSKIGQWNTHTYSATNKNRGDLADLVSSTKLPFWMSESGSGGEGLAGNLSMAQRMFSDLNVMQPQAWIDWQFVEEWNDQWCLIKGNFTSEWYEIVKNFYVRMQVTRFIKQGYTILSSPDERILTALSPEGDELVVVVLNNTDETLRFLVDLSLFESTGKMATRYSTDATYNCQKLASTNITNKRLICSVPKRGIMTYVLSVTAGEGHTELDTLRKYMLMPRIGSTVARADGSSVKLAEVDVKDTLQQWNISRLANGYYQFYVKRGGEEFAMTDNGAYNLAIGKRNANLAKQQFSIDSIAGRSIVLYSRSTGKSLDLNGEKTTPGNGVGLWAYATNYTNSHRQWKLLTIPFSEDPAPVGFTPVTQQACCNLFAEKGTLYLLCPDGKKQIQIRTVSGNSAVTLESNEQSVSIPLAPGMYIATIRTSSGSEHHKVYIP